MTDREHVLSSAPEEQWGKGTGIIGERMSVQGKRTDSKNSVFRGEF